MVSLHMNVILDITVPRLKSGLKNGIKWFILEIIEKHGPIAKGLCNKDPFAPKYMKDLSEWYPNSKFNYMIRDRRSVAHSIITRKVTITGTVSYHKVSQIIWTIR